MKVLLATILALILSSSAFCEGLTISKAKVEENLFTLRERQNLCESQLSSKEDMVLIKNDLKASVDDGQLSQKAMEQIIFMMGTMIETMENVCVSVDEMIFLTSIEIESKKETSAEFLRVKEEEMKIKAMNGFTKIQEQVNVEGLTVGERDLINIFREQVESLIQAIDAL